MLRWLRPVVSASGRMASHGPVVVQEELKSSSLNPPVPFTQVGCAGHAPLGSIATTINLRLLTL